MAQVFYRFRSYGNGNIPFDLDFLDCAFSQRAEVADVGAVSLRDQQRDLLVTIFDWERLEQVSGWGCKIHSALIEHTEQPCELLEGNMQTGIQSRNSEGQGNSPDVTRRYTRTI